MRFSHKVRGVAVKAIGVAYLAGSVLFPLEARSADYSRRCIVDEEKGWVMKVYKFGENSTVARYINEGSISRYNRGIDFVMCYGRQTYTFKVDCLSRVAYAMQNDFSYKKRAVIGSTSLFAGMCGQYYN